MLSHVQCSFPVDCPSPPSHSPDSSEQSNPIESSRDRNCLESGRSIWPVAMAMWGVILMRFSRHSLL